MTERRFHPGIMLGAHLLGVMYRVIFAGAMLALAGCTGLEPAALTAGASVAQTGVTIFDKGKARTAEQVSFDQALGAAQHAAANLSLKLLREEQKRNRVRCVYTDDRCDDIIVVVEGHTATMTLITVDVGALGEISFASLFMKQVLADLAKVGPCGEAEKPK